MIELILERWIDPGGTTFRWSVWRGGMRLGMGGPHADLQASEAEARSWCEKTVGQAPDRVTTL